MSVNDAPRTDKWRFLICATTSPFVPSRRPNDVTILRIAAMRMSVRDADDSIRSFLSLLSPKCERERPRLFSSCCIFCMIGKTDAEGGVINLRRDEDDNIDEYFRSECPCSNCPLSEPVASVPVFVSKLGSVGSKTDPSSVDVCKTKESTFSTSLSIAPNIGKNASTTESMMP